MESTDRSELESSDPSRTPSEAKSKTWIEANKTLFLTVIIGPCLVAILGIVAKDREQVRTKDIEIEKIKLEAETQRALALQRQEHEDAIREQDFERQQHRQTVAQRQRALAFYSAVLTKLDATDGIWYGRPTSKDYETLVRYDRSKLLPVYAEVQGIISENMDLVSLNPSMRDKISDFEKNVATYDSHSPYNPHYTLRSYLQWIVQVLGQQQ